MNKGLLFKTFRNITIASVYVLLISQLMQNGEKWFGASEAVAAFAILLLLSLSATVMGGLVFGQSIISFLENKKKESIQAAFYSVSWLAVYTAVVFIALALL